jgi:hypothetical protein
MSTLLTKIEQVTPDWLTRTLREAGVLPAGRVVAVEHSAVVAWNSDSYFLTLRYSDRAPDGAPRRLFLKLSRWGREEIEFYRFSADKRDGLTMLVPCYDAQVATGDDTAHLLLADLSATHFTPITKPMILVGDTMPSEQHLECMVDTIASFHAYWWEHPHLGKGFGRIRNWFDGEDGYRKHTERRRRELDAFLEGANRRIVDEVGGLYERVLAAFPRLWDRYLADRFGPMRAVTLSNGDCYFVQFLCPHTPGDTTYLIDFDSVSANLPAYDLVYMFATFWTTEQRQEGGREERLLRRYHDVLLARGVSGYTWDDLLTDYRLCVLYMAFDPVFDYASGASEAYWVPKMRCLTGAFRDLDCMGLLR